MVLRVCICINHIKGFVHTTLEKFENRGFTLKTQKTQQSPGHFGFVFEKNSLAEKS